MFVEDKANGEMQAYQDMKEAVSEGAVSREGFKAFLETKNPDESYPWPNSHECACAQYLKSIGKFSVFWGADALMGELNKVAAGKDTAAPWSHYHTEWELDSRDWTFGKCLERMKALA